MALAPCIRLLLELTLCLCFFHYPLVRAAVNLDGTHATEPATTENDPSPIDTLSTYYSEQYDCPLPCYDLANVHSWITYLSVDRLKRCNESMLLQLSTAQSLSDPRSTKLIRACTLSDSAVGAKISPQIENHYTLVDNPKLAEDVIERTIDIEPACAVRGISSAQNLASFSTSSDNGNPNAVDGAQIAHLLRGMHSFFSEEDNCNERFLFAHHKKVVAGVYVGAGLGKPTITSALEALATRLGVEDTGSIHNQTTVEFCSSQRTAERTFGLVVDTTGNLAGVQDLVLGWSQGKCSKDINGDIKRSSPFPGINIFDIAGSGVANNRTKANNTLLDTPWAPYHSRFKGDSPEALDRLLQRRDDTCNYMQVMPGDSLHSIAAKCGVATQALITHNSDKTIYGPLETYSYICCTSGKPFKPHAAELLSRAASTCTTHIIKDGDTCDALAKRYSVTVANLEKWNKGKTWAWTECKNMLIEYNMCVSAGDPPLPPPQQGTACGPLVPGTKLPSSSSTSLADLNPCPLKACCSNWGFCGPFPAHCDIHAPAGGGPGTKLPGYQSTCVSNCGMEIKQNSGSPASFERIGYYESWNMGRDCLWQQAKDANTDGTYTIMHWGFVDIDPQTWKPILKDPHSQWSGFKALKNVKRVVSFGGWAYSTEPATYNIIRQAIINNRETFASRLAQFVADENIDGIDIDWEYPGAPDILVNGKPIGEDGDGVAYLKFLSTLKQKMAKGKTVSIAAPASYWYLKAFPIDRIASTIDYIVYMTYDLHGQWDYGNPNAFDQCDSGKCIRSHINVTETRNSLALITKAGVPNNKIFVGESSYGRSFRMAREGCWGPMCEFTGSRIVSNARPGRCTATGGYLANAEIEEIMKYGNSVRSFKDPSSDSDILLYGGDYVSYMSLRTKIDRRNQWKGLNFAGTIDWAVDLQRFSDDDLDNITPGKDDDDTTCVSGEDISVESEDLCQFSCSFGFCPAPLCHCSEHGKPSKVPKARDNTGIIAWDESDAGLGRLCRFACKYGYCPKRICGTPVYEDTDEDGDKIEGAFDYKGAREQNAGKCLIFKDSRPQVGVDQCRSYCSQEVEQAEDEGLYANWGCGGVWPLDKPLPWQREFGGYFISGNCSCNNWLVNELAETVVEALPKIFQIGCQIFMSAIYLVVKIGLEAFPAGRAINAGLDMAATGAQTINYLYDKDNDPLSAFDWWILKTCGDTSLVPDEIKDVFDTLNQVVDGISFKTPKNLRKGSGKKGDNGNPPTKDRNPPPKQPPKTGPPPKAQRKKKCVIKPAKETVRRGAALNTLRVQSCSADMTIASDMVITELPYVVAPTPLPVTKTCSREYAQACMHYSSAIDVNPEWETLTCPHASHKWRQEGAATDTWKAQHTGAGWLDDQARPEPECDRDEYPPAYLQGPDSLSFLHSGKNSKGQLIRFLPRTENQAAGLEWKSMCFRPALERMSNADFTKNFKRAIGPPTFKQEKRTEVTSYHGSAPGTHRAELSWVWEHDRNPGGNHGLSINPCWPRNLAALDPGFTLLTFDPYYQGAATPYDYKRAHVQGANGS